MIHTDAWNAIEAMAADNHLTCSGLARRGGLCPTAFNKSKRETPEGKPRWPSLQSIAKVLDSIDRSMGYFADFMDRASRAHQ